MTIDAFSVVYMDVPGYIERETSSLAPPPQPVVVSASGIDPQFKESLFEWVVQQVRKTTQLFNQVQP